MPRQPRIVVPGQPLHIKHRGNNRQDILIYAFYRDLCDFYNDKQIIVLDNQAPSEDIQDSMNYVHFSKNDDIGRYGFFPLSRNYNHG